MATDHERTSTIVVVGEGSATLTPDAAVLRVSLEVRADSASGALGLVSERAEAVLRAITGREVAREDIKTHGIALHPQMDEQGRRVVAHVASYGLSVRLRDLAGAPAVVDAVSRAAGDALRLGGFQLSAAQSASARNDAAARAVEDARTKAERLASAAGVRLGRVLAIHEVGAGFPAPMPAAFGPRLARAAVPSPAAVPMEAGADDVVVRVTVAFEIAD